MGILMDGAVVFPFAGLLELEFVDVSVCQGFGVDV